MIRTHHSSAHRLCVGFAALLLLCGGGSAFAAADTLAPAAAPPDLYLSPEVFQADAAPAQPAPTADLQAKDFSLTLSPAMLADAAAPAETAAGGGKAPPAETKPPEKGPPLPLHTVEGTGGALFVPFAYVVDPGPPGTIATLPSASYTFVNVGGKFINQFATTWTLYRRIELGYSYGILGLGDFPQDVYRHTGMDTHFNHVELHTWNVRGVIVEENSYHLPLPQITGGLSFKYNPDVADLNDNLTAIKGGKKVGVGAVAAVGYKKDHSVDYTLTASKTIPNAVFTRPIIVTGGIRFSEAAQLGYLGFGKTYRMTGEGDVCLLVTDWWAISYEYRQKKDPYTTMEPLVGKESNWQAICMAFILSPRATFACGWGDFGQVVNHRETGAWGIQFKYEF